ncbi:MAG TPA: lysophospholipid acyltransferase family protein [Candidatus Methylacidiphilales bacterium]|nr:lysophospholipid acyltransferase family protein [Candidatus Methylacidiphilales bacterium]
MIAALFAAGVRLFTGVQARWLGCEPDAAQRVYFANHTSNLDFLVLWSVLPAEARRKTRPVAASDYWRGGKLRLFLADRVFRGVLIERKKVTRSNNPMDQLVPVLQGGESLIIFPEGGRTTEPEMRPFKSGLYHLAKAVPAVDLVPVYIDNANRVLPKGEFLPIPLLCSANFGAPLRLQTDEPKDAFLTRARAAVEALAEP